MKDYLINSIRRNIYSIKNISGYSIKSKLGLAKPMSNTIVVASLSRCGSTLVVNCLSKAYQRQKSRLDIVRLDDHINMDYRTTNETIERGFDGNEAEELRGQYLKGYVYKTHDLAPPNLPEHVKVIFMFGNPVDIVLSIKELDKNNLTGVDSRFTSLDLAIRNFRGNLDEKNKIFEKDVLRLRDNFECWFRKQNYPVMALRYETMWSHVDEIRAFTGFNSFNLPPYKSRKNLREKYEDSTLMAIERTHEDLINKIESCDDVTYF